MKPKIQYIDRKCTLCNDNDIQDEYHIVLKCAYYNEVGKKYIKLYYHRFPSMYKFQELMSKSNKRDTFRLLIFIKIVIKIMIQLCNLVISSSYCYQTLIWYPFLCVFKKNFSFRFYLLFINLDINDPMTL